MRNSLLRLEGVSHRFGAIEVLRALSLEIYKGEFVAIVGPSGCGKTTILNLLSGHERPTVGYVDRSGVARMVYQHDGLFPWQTVTENIALGLRSLRDPAQRNKQIRELLALIGLEKFASHYPHQLSGGMRQRVELARALAGDSDCLLMDEPFSALDYLTRLRLRSELAQILAERPRTVVFVTHDVEEAAQLADRVVVLSERPAKIRCELSISTPRPRGVSDPEVVRTAERILTELGLRTDRENIGACFG